jgi:FdhD protein
MDYMQQRMIRRLTERGLETVGDLLVVEKRVVVNINGEEAFSASCSPGKLRELVYGFLLSTGMIHTPDDVLSFSQNNGYVFADIRSSEKSSIPPVKQQFVIPAGQMLATAEEAKRRGRIFYRTGGTHSVAISAASSIIIFIEDISRTCALDKAVGEAFISQVDLSHAFVFLSSRIDKRMLAKLARCGVPIIGCVSAPTAQAVELAERLGVCLCGFVRGERLNIYSNPERITDE